MKNSKIVAMAALTAVIASALPLAAAQQPTAPPPVPRTSLVGTAKAQATRPYTDYSVRARDIQDGSVAGSAPLDDQGNFTLSNLSAQRYLVELVNKNGKVVCTEGPLDLARTPARANLVVDCGKIPAAWWLVGAAAAAGITAGVVAGPDASASR
jgi:hypothetical protein